jgi:hypothetical protein
LTLLTVRFCIIVGNGFLLIPNDIIFVVAGGFSSGFISYLGGSGGVGALTNPPLNF